MTSYESGAQTLEKPDLSEGTQAAKPWVTVVFNDPVNLMSYVTYVFQSYFGYNRSRAEKLMRQVHEEGRATVSTGTREQMERDTAALHGFGLWASCRPAEGDT